MHIVVFGWHICTTRIKMNECDQLAFIFIRNLFPWRWKADNQSEKKNWKFIMVSSFLFFLRLFTFLFRFHSITMSFFLAHNWWRNTYVYAVHAYSLCGNITLPNDVRCVIWTKRKKEKKKKTKKDDFFLYSFTFDVQKSKKCFFT